MTKLFAKIDVFKKVLVLLILERFFLTIKSLGFMSALAMQKNFLKHFVFIFENSHLPLEFSGSATTNTYWL